MTTAIVTIPRLWASNATFATGVDAGQPSKVDPGAALSAEGFEPGPVIAAHTNHLLNGVTAAARVGHTLALCQARSLGIRLLDNFSFAPVSTGANFTVLGTAQYAGCPLLADAEHFAGLYAAPIGLNYVAAGAYAPGGRLVLVGSTASAYLTALAPATAWTAGGALTAAAQDLTYNATFSRFVCLQTGNIGFSTNATAWTNVVVAGAGTASPGIGTLANGNMLICTAATVPTFSISTNGGTSWASTGTTVPNSAAIAGGNSVCGAALDSIYHLATVNDGTNQLSVTADGATWSAIKIFTAPTGWTFAGASNGNGNRILQCPDSGLLFALMPVTASTSSTIISLAIMASADRGVTWTDPVLCGTNVGTIMPFAPNIAGASCGKLFLMSLSGELFVVFGEPVR